MQNFNRLFVIFALSLCRLLMAETLTSSATPLQLCRAVQYGAVIPDVIDITNPAVGSGIPPADPSSVLDSYESFLAASRYFSNLNGNVHRVLVIPQGDYKIDRYIDRRSSNPAQDIQFVKSKNFRIIGCNARISVKGDFAKTVDPQNHYATMERSVVPFSFSQCSSFQLVGLENQRFRDSYGLELDGNVDKTSRPAGVYEDWSHGVMTDDCRDYQITNVYAHHFAADGFMIGAGNLTFSKMLSTGNYYLSKADINGKLDSIIAANNARNGLSVVQISNLVVTKSQFIGSGRTGRTANGLSATLPAIVSRPTMNGQPFPLDVNPTFSGFAPMAGVDVEPNYPANLLCTQNCAQPDIATVWVAADHPTENVAFQDCYFGDSLQTQFVTGVGSYANNIMLTNPVIQATYGIDESRISREPNSWFYPMIANTNNVFVILGKVDTGPNTMLLSPENIAWDTVNDPSRVSKYSSVSTVLFDTEIHTSGSGIASSGDRKLQIFSSKMIGKHKKAFDSYMPLLENSHAESAFYGNSIYFPKEGYRGSGMHPVSKIQKNCSGLVMNNVFTSDLITANPSTDYLTLGYEGSKVGVAGYGDTFSSVFFRPYVLLVGLFPQVYFKNNCL